MEKKLTDEEIAQALLQNIEYSKTLTYFDKWGNHKAIMITDIIDFIHRLQDEKQELKSIAEYQQGSNMERWQIIQEKDKTIAEQKAEIERLTEENEYLDMCGKQFLADYQKCEIENAELQKQADELKEEIKKAYEIERANLQAEIAETGTSCQWCERQTVKDTAKEFADLVEFHSVATMEDNVEYFTISALGLKEILREDFGVEGEK